MTEDSNIHDGPSARCHSCGEEHLWSHTIEEQMEHMRATFDGGYAKPQTLEEYNDILAGLEELQKEQATWGQMIDCMEMTVWLLEEVEPPTKELLIYHHDRTAIAYQQLWIAKVMHRAGVLRHQEANAPLGDEEDGE